MREPLEDHTAHGPRRPAVSAIVWINGIPHVPLGGNYGSRRERARLRRTMASWIHGQQEGVVLEHSAGAIHWHGVSVHLTPLQFRVVSILVAAKGAMVSRDELLLQAWGHLPAQKGDELVRAQIAGIRRALRSAGLADRLIQNVWGGSYRLAVPVDDTPPEAAS